MLLCVVLLLSPFLAVQANDHQSSVFDIDLKGNYHWELLFDIDNTKNAGKIVREVEVVTSVAISYKDMKRSLESSRTSASMSASLGGTFFEILNIGVQGELSNEVKSEYEHVSETNQEVRKTTTKKDTYEVGPHSSLKLYRLVFQGPGINFQTDTLVSNPHSRPEVKIAFKVKQTSVLKDIQVVYTQDSISRPSNLISEINGKNPDINSGFGGKYVWLVPVWTKKVSEGATGISIAIQGEANPNYSDMASGAGGSYRYIKMLHDSNSNRRITQVNLFRSTDGGNQSTPVQWTMEISTVDKMEISTKAQLNEMDEMDKIKNPCKTILPLKQLTSAKSSCLCWLLLLA